MGCVISANRHNQDAEYNKLNIYSYNVGTNNIKHIRDIIVNDDTIDIICLQNFHDVKDITEFIGFINKFNKTTSKRYEIYPNSINSDYKKPDANTIHIAWSYTLGDEHQDIDGLIISRYPIITSSKINIVNAMFETKKYFYLVNVLFHGTIISVFNVVLQPNFTGILNNKIRKRQIDELVNCITQNTKNYNNNNITIICGNINIEEYNNNTVNYEYIDMIRKLNGLDTYRYVMTMKNNDDKTKYMIRNDYIILVVDDICTAKLHTSLENQMQYISERLYNKYNTYINNSTNGSITNASLAIKNNKNNAVDFDDVYAVEID